MPTNGWGYFQQGSDQMLEMEELGSWLSLAIDCPVHYPAFNKNLFECDCGVIFPVFAVKTKDKDIMVKQHQEGFRLVDPAIY